ncbi:MAG: hypothetical protein KGL39_27440 [Patescibacteria group bacterium]|nr:hypothetical protein [Patescibacteria group bacterium]
MRQYGLYLYRSSVPLYVGTQADCHRETRNLSDAEWLHGWTVKPVPEEREPAWVPMPYSERIWALVGTGILLFVAITSYFALRGRI